MSALPPIADIELYRLDREGRLIKLVSSQAAITYGHRMVVLRGNAMWEDEEYRPNDKALKTLAQFREILNVSWLGCEVLIAVREWSGTDRGPVALQLVFERFWPVFKAFSSISAAQFLMMLDRCGLVKYVFSEQGGDRDVEAIETAIALAMTDWVQTGNCDGKIHDIGLGQTLRDAIGFSLTKTRDLNVPGAEVFVSSLSEASASESADVAILMPFRRSQRAVYDKSIRPACSASGLACQRADEFYGSQHIVSEIFSLIKNARIVLSDISGLNPNVLYETGIAHTIGKPVLIIAQRGTKVPFDVQHLRRLEYSKWGRGLTRLSAAIETALADMLVNPLRQT